MQRDMVVAVNVAVGSAAMEQPPSDTSLKVIDTLFDLGEQEIRLIS
jgi:hypothetical protein